MTQRIPCNYAEYIWLDGTTPTQQLRSKTRVLPPIEGSPELNNFPDWSFDGSSTYQASSNNSDCALKPIYFVPDPFRKPGSYLILCEVFTEKKEPHPTNKRAELRRIMTNGGKAADIYIGFEQEYTLMDGRDPLGWPKEGFPGPQGPFYCGVGAEKVFGREIMEKHMEACSQANLAIYGTNAEVMPGQWEFQIGYRGIKGEETNPLTMADQVWLARYLLIRVAEQYEIGVSLENKPIKGDWNGAGMHTNFSSNAMRVEGEGIKEIHKAIERLEQSHKSHVLDYGHGLASRLTGLHETCDISTFKSGISDRGASIRIPMSTIQKGCGYFEDRRPGANADPYKVASRLIQTTLEIK